MNWNAFCKLGFMRKKFLSTLFLTVCCNAYFAGAQVEQVAQVVPVAVKPFRTCTNVAFTTGEKLKFRVHYGWLDAGEATLEVAGIKSWAGRDCFHIVGTGRSMGAVDVFFKIRDRYETYLDKESMFPWYFIRRVNEGGYIINQNVSFNHYSKIVLFENYKEKPTGLKDTIIVPANIQDLLSAFYYSRSLDFSNATEGDLFPVSALIDKEIVSMNFKYAGKEVIKSKLGKIRCIKFKPQLQQGRVFKNKEEMTIWVSDDKNHVPIRVESQVIVGSIKMDLEECSGLANPLSLIK
jgi:hypothetical protein